MEDFNDIRELQEDLKSLDAKRKKEDVFPQALFVLYGNRNKGKTTSLTELVFKLVSNPVIISQIKKHIIRNNINKKTKSYKNGCYVIQYNGKWIFLSTWGDDRKSCELNINFFYGIPVNKNIYLIDKNGFTPLKRGTAYTLHRPDICITASHGDDDSLPPTLYLANKQLEPCKWQIWRHKMGDQGYQNEDGIYVSKEDDEVANELKDMIDYYVIKSKKVIQTTPTP